MRHAYWSSSTHFKSFIQASQSSEALRYIKDTRCNELRPIRPKHSPIRSNEWPMLKISFSKSLKRSNGQGFGRMLLIRANGHGHSGEWLLETNIHAHTCCFIRIKPIRANGKSSGEWLMPFGRMAPKTPRFEFFASLTHGLILGLLFR